MYLTQDPTDANIDLRNEHCTMLCFKSKHLIESSSIHVDSGADWEDKSERRHVVKPLQQKNCVFGKPKPEIVMFVFCGLCPCERETPQVK